MDDKDRMLDLFPQLGLPPMTPRERQRKNRSTKGRQKGYAAMPGSGPQGETCKTCKHYTIRQMAGSFRKCGLMVRAWTNSYGTDILASSPACQRWEKPEDGA